MIARPRPVGLESFVFGAWWVYENHATLEDKINGPPCPAQEIFCHLESTPSVTCADTPMRLASLYRTYVRQISRLPLPYLR